MFYFQNSGLTDCQLKTRMLDTDWINNLDEHATAFQYDACVPTLRKGLPRHSKLSVFRYPDACSGLLVSDIQVRILHILNN